MGQQVQSKVEEMGSDETVYASTERIIDDRV